MSTNDVNDWFLSLPVERQRALLEAGSWALTNAAWQAARATQPSAPINMVLHCPACGQQHIDAQESINAGPDERGRRTPSAVTWTNPPHRSHLCAGCGHIWRPADVPTNGVKEVKTKSKNDSPIAQPSAPTVPQGWQELLEALAYGPQHPGYITGVPMSMWAEFAREMSLDAKRLLAQQEPKL